MMAAIASNASDLERSHPDLARFVASELEAAR